MKLSNNPAKYEVLIKQYLRSILDISEKLKLYTNSLAKVLSDSLLLNSLLLVKSSISQPHP